MRSILLTTAFVISASALNVGVAKLPVLGYNTWNAYQCNINEGLVLETARLMRDLGLQAAGYNQLNLDDCYALRNRSSSGDIVADPAKFPSGMKNLTTQLNSLGLKAGIYSDSGWFTCGGFPGSYNNEERDLKTFSDWGFEYLKYDNCASGHSDLIFHTSTQSAIVPYDSITREGIVGRYTRMANAVANHAKQTHKAPFVFSLCEWGWNQVWVWGKTLGQSWRTTGDIAPEWNSLANIINFNSFITTSTGFYGRNDLDMLQLGNGNMTFEEAKSHFTAWALMKSPLFIGTNLSAITNETLQILTNGDILAINQDPMHGESISPFRWGINPDWTSNSTHPAQYWSGPSQNGTVFMMLNTLDEPSTMTFNLTESPWIRAGRQYSVRDLWAHTNNGTAVRNLTTTLPAHGVVALLLKDAGNEPDDLFPACSVWWQCTDKNGTRVGG